MSFFNSLSAKEQYGFLLLSQLAKTYGQKQPLSLTTISEQEGISLKYLEQLIRPFCRAGWVKSVRGQKGGYLMVKNPQALSLKNLLAVINGQQFLVECLRSSRSRRCPLEEKCLSKSVWRKVQNSLERQLKAIKVADLLS